MNPIRTSIARINLLESNFLRIEYDADSHIDLPELEEALKIYRKLMGDEKFYALTVVNSGVSVSERARKYWASAERSKIKLAEAFVINRIAHALLANFVLAFQPPKHTLKFFNTEKAAMAWLRSQQKKKPG